MDNSSTLLRRALLRIEELQAKLDVADAANAEPIALIGLGCRLPGGIDSPDALWSLLSEGRDAIGDIPLDRWDIDAMFDPEPATPGKMYTKRGGFLREVDRFDAAFFGISPREAVRLDPQQRLLLEVSWEAIERAGIAPLSLRGSATGVYIGQATYDYAQLQIQAGDPAGFDTYFATGTAASVTSGRLSYTLGLQGPALTTDTACSSSLVALHLACQALRRRECDMAIAGGVNLILAPEAVIAMSQSRMMAPDGVCKTFDAAADGFGQAEGCVVVVVKRLADALRDGDTVVALIRGSAVNQDGASSGLTAPNGQSQIAVIRAAFRDARISPDDCSYVEAHGTGTTLGDPIEIQAMDAAFGAGRAGESRLWTGSIKTNLGHLEAASGLAGLLKVVLSFQHRQIPAHLHFTRPNPLIPWADIGVQVADRSMPFPQRNGRRVAGVSAFGFSGTNAHIVLEEAPAPANNIATPGDRPLELLTLSARGGVALGDAIARFRKLLGQDPAPNLGDIAFSANTGRSPLTHRIALVCASAAEADDQLAHFLSVGQAQGLHSAELENGDPPRIAFLFTGQGAQYPGMGRSLYENEPVFRAAFDDCDARFAACLGGSIVDVVYRSADATKLTQTQWTQPALFAIEWSLAQLWLSWGITPGLVIGHSIGEYVAACVSGVFTLDDAVKLVSARATLMGDLPEGGAMAAVLADEPDIAPILAKVPQVSLAAVNGPKSCVISGPVVALGEAERGLVANGISTVRLDVSHAFHSSMLNPMLDAFQAVGDAIVMSEPTITFVSTLTGKAARRGIVSNGRYWRDQTRGTVRFADGLRVAHALGYRVFVELGPRPTLTRLAIRTLDEDSLCLSTLDDDQDPWRSALNALGRLYLKGAAVDWRGFHGAGRARLALPTYPFQRSRFWLDQPSPRIVGPHAAAEAGHPHLAQRTDTALGETIFAIRLDPATHPYLADHRVHGSAIVATACYLDLIVAAVAETTGTLEATIEDLIIHQPVSIPTGGRDLQLLLNPRGVVGQLELFSRDSDSWSLAVSGRFIVNATTDHAVVAPESGELHDIAVDRFYIALDRIGLNFGPSFHRVVKLRRRDGAAESEISAFPAQGFCLHPVVLDGCLQTLAAALPGFDPESLQTDVYMPICIDRFALFERSNGPLRSICHFDPQLGEATATPPEMRVGHVIIENAGGTVLARISGVRMKRARDVPPPVLADDSLYQVAWHGAELIGEAQPAVLADFDGSALNSVLATGFDRLAHEHGLNGQVELEPILDRLCAGYVLDALKLLGWWAAPDSILNIDALIAQVVPRHQRLIRRLLAMLVEDGVIAARGHGKWQVLRDMAADAKPDVAALIDRFPQFRAEIQFAQRGGQQLAAALRGEIDAAEVLFPGGSFGLADDLYRQSPAAQVFNHLASAAVTAAVRAVPPGRPLRILEVGGGTGGVTSAILPVLPPQLAEYMFTDISPAFLQKARLNFAAYPFLTFECLDIERSPAGQGFALNAYDLVVASNVLHATNDLGRTLDHVRSLLAPGGQLLVLEGLKPARWIDLSFGLTEGWWRFSDTGLRSDYPLISAAAWRSLLKEKGFSDPWIAPDGDNYAWVGQGLIWTRAAAPATAASSSATLVFADAAGAADRLADALGPETVIVRAATAFADFPAFEIDPLAPEHYRRLFAGLKAEGRLPDTIVFLWPIDAAMGADASLEALTAQLEHCCSSLLYLLQACAAVANGGAVTLWIVTRGSQSVLPSDRLDGLVQSALLGMAKVAALELPEIACHRLDLEVLEDIDALRAELFYRPGEPVVAIRGGRRYIPRLVQAVLPDHSFGTGRDLRIDERGSFSGLALRQRERTAVGANDVEIRVAASGLNFRDVLNVLGARDDDAPFGGEVSGVITRVGASVQVLAAGQSVMAVTYGGHGEYALAPAALTLPKPSNLDWTQAAGVSLAYLTAYYALEIIGHMRRGERILIHAAAGGVGMAAVYLARRAGLEVFATAGNSAKRAMLTGIGVRHVYDSRRLDFAEAIRRDTDNQGVDLVLSAVTGPAIAAGLGLLGVGGRYLEIGKAEILTQAQAQAINPAAHYQALDLAELIIRAPAEVRPWFVEINDRVARNDLPPLPTQSFPLVEAAAAFEHMARARHVGKVVLEVCADPTGEAVAPARSPTILPDATYLISGGLSGLGLASAQHLVELGARHLLLFGRRAPSLDAELAIATLRARDVEVCVVSADAGSEADMQALFDGPLRAMPPLRGVIHSAGRLEDGALPQQSWGRFRAVFGPKIFGAWLLHRLCADQALDFFVLYSSASAVLGAPGQSNHAAANAFLDGLAAHRQARGLPALSLNWGAWADIGAAAGAQVRQRLGGRGVASLSVAEGLAALERLLGRSAAQVAVIRADWNRVAEFIESSVERRFLAELVHGAAPANDVVPDRFGEGARPVNIHNAPIAKRAALLSALVKDQVAQILGVAGAAAVSENQPFRDMGLDSLMALELRTRLKKALDLEAPLPATLAFDYPTVSALLDHLMYDILGWSAAPDPAAAPAPERTKIAEIEQMSDDEIDRMLIQRQKTKAS